MGADRHDNQLRYWLDLLGDGIEALDLPGAARGPDREGGGKAAVTTVLPAGCVRDLQSLGERHGADLFMTLLAGLFALLRRYTGRDDVAVGTVVASRVRQRAASLADGLVFRVDLAGDPSFEVLIGRVRDACLTAHGNQDVSFDLVLRELARRPRARPANFFQVMFTRDAPPLRLGPSRPGMAADLVVQVGGQDPVTVGFRYDSGVFGHEIITQLAAHYRALLEAAAANPRDKISRPSLLTRTERHRVLVEWNDTGSARPADACLHQLFERQAMLTPGAVAVGGPAGELTYRQLNRRANQLAHYLRERGAEADVPVGVRLPRSPDAIVAILAILKAGAGYLPISPDYPVERAVRMLRDARAPLVISSGTWPSRLGDGTAVLDLAETRQQLGAYPRDNPAIGGGPGHLAYVIYTSGSTGQPKGVRGTHRGMVNVVGWLNGAYPPGPGQVAAQRTSLVFVDAVWEIFAPLLAGIPLVIAQDEVARDPGLYVEFAERHRVTRTVVVPSFLNVLLQVGGDLSARLASARYWFSSGEPLSAELAGRFRDRLPGAVLLNIYGSSEVSADATYYDCTASTGEGTIPIGRPIANTQAYILDTNLEPVPVGVAGEIHIGGAGVARGYLSAPDLTREKFIKNPFSSDGSSPLYRTGDIGRYRPDGNIEYLGRKDAQIKIHGVRIEPAEIEAGLSKHPGIREVAVGVSYRGAVKRLAAYYVPLPGAPALERRELRRFLKESLPGFMIPSLFIHVDALPRTSTGKIDRAALRAISAPDNSLSTVPSR